MKKIAITHYDKPRSLPDRSDINQRFYIEEKNADPGNRATFMRDAFYLFDRKEGLTHIGLIYGKQQAEEIMTLLNNSYGK